ncbi:prepilin peptidase [Pseudooceanicola aestuarii]|uniref:prepilin peptidase n=1 Tax=Pseudooceanicola aestuarii TaxID=2697319 RepID=UPI0013D0803C|nr:prepilin peptidase [Pseudooceanicola aestuarii]
MLALPQMVALVFLPFVLPICAHAAWTDLRAMRISNYAVLALAAVFILLGPFLYPLETYGWRLLTLAVVLVVGIVANAMRLLGAGDAKFIAAAAPYIDPADLRLLIAMSAAILLAAFASHRIAQRTPLRNLAPDWESWQRQGDFPMGFPLGATLAGYLLLGAFT